MNDSESAGSRLQVDSTLWQAEPSLSFEFSNYALKFSHTLFIFWSETNV